MEHKPKVLVVDDDESIRELMQVYLEDDFKVLHATSGSDAVKLTKEENLSLMVLDIMLPNKSGWEVCKEVRSFCNIPIIMITAKSEEYDRIYGLELGADDYICKPFSPKELLARVKAQIRRSTLLTEPNFSQTFKSEDNRKITEDGIVELSGLIIDLKKYRATLYGSDIDLTAKEIQLLALLMLHEGHVFSREQLLQKVWGFDYIGDSRAVDSAIKRLRKKLSKIENTKEFIHSIRGIGYKFEVENP